MEMGKGLVGKVSIFRSREFSRSADMNQYLMNVSDIAHDLT